MGNDAKFKFVAVKTGEEETGPVERGNVENLKVVMGLLDQDQE